MPTAAPASPRSSVPYWGLALAATSLVTIGGGAIIWSHREPAERVVAQAPPGDAEVITKTRRVPPLPPPIDSGGQSKNLHEVIYAVENGTAVVKIKIVPDGDQLVVDAATGRLLETR